jgi:hypothetical protein
MIKSVLGRGVLDSNKRNLERNTCISGFLNVRT